MMFYDFQTSTHGKWILTGEHTVIRGGGALVFPVKTKGLHLDYRAGNAPFTLSYGGSCGADFAPLMQALMEYALRCLARPSANIQGHFHWHADLPLGQGMGASAALCVAMTRWFIAQQWLDPQAHFHFARILEDFFHGKSSGLDIAGVAAEGGVYFEKGECQPINADWQPQWYLSSSHERGNTLHCVKKVEALHKTNSTLAKKLDDQMQTSVLEARMALERKNPEILISAINKAAACFEGWGLVSPALQSHMQSLRARGALAVKPTGSGGGGYVISLWDLPPPSDLVLLAV